MKWSATDCDMCHTFYKVNRRTGLCEICEQAKAQNITIHPFDIKFANGDRIDDLLCDAEIETRDKMPFIQGVWLSPRALNDLYRLLTDVQRDLRTGAELQARDKVQMEAAQAGLGAILSTVLKKPKKGQTNKDVAINIALEKSKQDNEFFKKEVASGEKMREFVKNARLTDPMALA